MRFALLTLLLAAVATIGCSSSKQPAPAAQPSTAAPASTAAQNAPELISGDAKVDAALQKSCYTCHANGTSAPWYAAVSPTYLAAGSARNALNFSVWPTYDPQKRAAEMKSIAKSVDSGAMPPGDYTALDHSARLTADEKQALLDWASQANKKTH